MKFKDIKNISIISAVLLFIYKIFKAGENKQKLKTLQTNEKIIKKRKNINHIDDNNELSDRLRKGKF